MTEEIGNEANMEKIRSLINKQDIADEVNRGSKATNSVSIDYVSDFGNTYKGTVVFKRPSVMDFMKMGGAKSEILRLAGVKNVELVDGGVKVMAQIMATLKTVIVKSPEWLIDIDSVQDTDLLFHVHGKYQDWEDSFRRTIETDTTEGDSQASE